MTDAYPVYECRVVEWRRAVVGPDDPDDGMISDTRRSLHHEAICCVGAVGSDDDFDLGKSAGTTDFPARLFEQPTLRGNPIVMK